MKGLVFNHCLMKTMSVLLVLSEVLLAGHSAKAQNIPIGDAVEVRPVDNGTALENPDMGWVFHHYDNSIGGYGPPLGSAYDGHEFPGLTVAYLRLAWSHLEPKEGRFNWSILDTPIQRYGAAGKKFAFRFTVFEGDPKQGTPEWVRASGARGTMVKTYGVESWEPDYDDPIFLGHLKRFLDEVGKRYGSNPNLAFVDVGTLGIWGEGHPIARNYGLATLRRHIELHQQAFPNVLLVGNDDWATWFHDEGKSKTAALDMARELGLTFRDDSLCVYPDPKTNYSAPLAQPFWPLHPVILEMGHYAMARENNAWGDGSRYLQAVEDYHGSYISIHANPIEFLKENADLVRRINLRLGYRLNLVWAAWQKGARHDSELVVGYSWRNAGVAPYLKDRYMTWSLFDTEGNLCATLIDDRFNMNLVEPGGKLIPIQHALTLPPGLKSGEYEIRVSVGDLDGTPRLQLPLDGDDGHHRYRLGKVTLD
ncbi:hypothetical protein IAD21_00859 [Abditibacteriota bacterium]|nr:hypothetical protein IAD21_00859 [Abditibacteriota bacterium]